MVSKIYAVKIGRSVGIFSSWKDCEKQVKGFPSAQYKSFTNLTDATNYLQTSDNINTIKNNQNSIVEYNSQNIDEIDENSIVENNSQNIDENTAIAYTDGSYSSKTKEYGCGVVILYKNKEITFSFNGNDKDYISMRNVAGEILAAQKAMNFCIENNIKNLILYYDYQGIEKWCTEEWKSNKIGTQNYKLFYDNIKHKLTINFIWIKSHSNNKYNDFADKLAKLSLGLI